MAQAAFKKGRTNRKRCKAMRRDGTPCGMLAMTRYGLEVCGAHGGFAAVVHQHSKNEQRQDQGEPCERSAAGKQKKQTPRLQSEAAGFRLSLVS